MAHNQKLLVDPNSDTGNTLSNKVNNQTDRILSNFLETSDGGPPDGIQPGGIWTRRTNTNPPIFEIMLRTSSGTQESERDVVLNRVNAATGDVASSDVVNLAANSGVGSTEVSGILNTVNGGIGMSIQNNTTGYSQFRTQYGITSAIEQQISQLSAALTTALTPRAPHIFEHENLVDDSTLYPTTPLRRYSYLITPEMLSNYKIINFRYHKDGVPASAGSVDNTVYYSLPFSILLRQVYIDNGWPLRSALANGNRQFGPVVIYSQDSTPTPNNNIYGTNYIDNVWLQAN